MEKSSNHIIVIAGEDSGDLHGALLVSALKKLRPDLEFSGLGGPKMQSAGVKLYYDFTKLAVMGFVEILKHYSEFKRIFDFILKQIKTVQPVAVILIDYPGFNLRIAKKLKSYNTKVIYYISPQVWAWKKNRVFTIKENVDRMLVFFQFEKEFYARYGIDVDFVGHPLIDTVSVNTHKEKVLSRVDFLDYKMTIGLLPGSRKQEVERHLPVMLETAQILRQEFPMIQFLLIKAPSIPRSTLKTMTDKLSFKIPIMEENVYDAIGACDLCLVTSGTATLETAILGKPMVVMYKTSWSTWMLAKMVVKIPHISLVNIVAQKEIVPEFIQDQANAPAMAKALKDIFTDEIKIATMKDQLRIVSESLGTSPASFRAAEAVIKAIETKS
ncbi:MAG: lipid-A-disaccharide synthase [Candidatus Omnitrophica bacterium]|nr:lipid-A-disaccharide synthase [Candidatus Omnitrophota bacterium]